MTWRLLGALSLILCAAGTGRLIAGERGWSIWLQAILQGLVGILWLAMPWLMRRQMRALARSVQRNHEVLAQSRAPDPTPDPANDTH